MAMTNPYGEDEVNCPDCNGTGNRQIPMFDDWGEFEYYVERRCSFCGGSGKFDAIQAQELAAEIHAAGGRWYE